MSKINFSSTNLMSVDVEDYFQVSAFENNIKRDKWDTFECRVERNISKILEIFERHNVTSTFFVLGWIAKRYPQVVRNIVDQGHEVASHGTEHKRVTEQSPDEFKQDILDAKNLLEDLAGVEVKGYRAPSFSINDKNMWALDVIKDCGYRYNSSIYPVQHDLYGMPDAPRFQFSHDRNGIAEVPMSTIRINKKNFPCSGGGFFRLYPYWFSKWAINNINKKEGKPAIFYFHPWEVDPDQPRIQGARLKSRFRHYLNLKRMENKLNKLCEDFSWQRIDQKFGF